jgi:adenine phosphoribosyltransferase
MDEATVIQSLKLDKFDRHEDWPTEGVTFYDIQGILKDFPTWRQSILELGYAMTEWYPTHLIAADARGFLIAGALSSFMGLPIVMARKAGKLPGDCHSADYNTEYSTASMQIKHELLDELSRPVLVDDVLATGGTAQAMAELCKQSGATPVGMVTMLQLAFLGGATRLEFPVHAWCRI